MGVYSFSIEMDCYVNLLMIIFALLYLIEIALVFKLYLVICMHPPLGATWVTKSY